jgi:hypothetical protein
MSEQRTRSVAPPSAARRRPIKTKKELILKIWISSFYFFCSFTAQMTSNKKSERYFPVALGHPINDIVIFYTVAKIVQPFQRFSAIEQISGFTV